MPSRQRNRPAASPRFSKPQSSRLPDASHYWTKPTLAQQRIRCQTGAKRTVLDRNAAHWQRTNLGTPSSLRLMRCQTQHQTTRSRVFEGEGWCRGPKPICSPAKQAASTDPRSASQPGLWPLLSCPMQSHPRCCQARHPEPGSQARCGRTEHPNSTSLPSLCLFFSGPNQSHASRRNARPSRAHRHRTLTNQLAPSHTPLRAPPVYLKDTPVGRSGLRPTQGTVAVAGVLILRPVRRDRSTWPVAAVNGLCPDTRQTRSLTEPIESICSV